MTWITMAALMTKTTPSINDCVVRPYKYVPIVKSADQIMAHAALHPSSACGMLVCDSASSAGVRLAAARISVQPAPEGRTLR